MPSANLIVERVGPESAVVLRNLFEHYYHDMAEWFVFDTGPDGSYSEDTSGLWDQGYDAYLAKVDGALAGFALIGSADEWLGDIGAHDIHEFFVIRRHRRNAVGHRMAVQLWDERPGEWLVRVYEANVPAVPFWRNAIASYTRSAYQEERCIVNGRPWRYFRFAAVTRPVTPP